MDYDFFSDKPLDKEALETAFPFITGASVLQDQPDTFTVVVSEGEAQEEHVKLSFFGAIGFGRVENRKQQTTVSCGWHRGYLCLTGQTENKFTVNDDPSAHACLAPYGMI